MMKMTMLKLTGFIAACGLMLANPVYADHMSIWGEGWANMPNDIHNTRLDPTVSDTEFMEFVQFGSGSESVNRYADDDSTVSGGGMAGSFNQGTEPVSTGGRDRGGRMN